MIYPLSLGLHSQTDVVAAINDLNARLTAIERPTAPVDDAGRLSGPLMVETAQGSGEFAEHARDYDPAVSALCGVTLRDPDGDPCGLSSEDARAIVAAIRAG